LDATLHPNYYIIYKRKAASTNVDAAVPMPFFANSYKINPYLFNVSYLLPKGNELLKDECISKKCDFLVYIYLISFILWCKTIVALAHY
jgi:hypothetical protein